MSRPVVVKLGSSLVADERGRVGASCCARAPPRSPSSSPAGTPVCVVSSGAIALGLARWGSTRGRARCRGCRPHRRSARRALQRAWEEAFGAHGLRRRRCCSPPPRSPTGAPTSTSGRPRRALRARRRAGRERERRDGDRRDHFGDNDALAAQVAVLVRARLLVLLTSVEGVSDTRPSRRATLIARGGCARGGLRRRPAHGRGGMESKVAAAELAAAAGIPTVIAGGAGDDVLGPLVAGEARGTRFAPGRTGSGVQAVASLRQAGRRDDHGRRRRPPRGRDRARACSRSASSTGRRTSARATASSSRRRRRRSRGGSPRSTLPSSPGGPADVEAVHRDRLVLL